MKKLVSFKNPKPKSPVEIIRATNLSLQSLIKSPSEKAIDEVTKNIKEIKDLLYGNTEKYPSEETSVQITLEVFSCDFVRSVIHCVPLVDFETRKAISQIVVNIQGQFVNSRLVAADYFAKNLDLIDILFQGYDNNEVALFYGSMLRESIRHQAVAKYLLESKNFQNFFKYVDVPSFEVASDAAATFKELMTRHKSTVADFLERNYDSFMKLYIPLLESPNYATRRLATKTLGDILLDRSNSSSLKRFVSDVNNLQIVMNLFKGQSKAIQFEAFNLFKAFVLNEQKTKEVASILVFNKEKLLGFLSALVTEKENTSFDSDKAQVMEALKLL